MCKPMETVVGYMGGTGSFPTYNNYTTANNYSETVRILYDTRRTTFKQIMDEYFTAAAVWGGPGVSWTPQEDPAYQLRVFVLDASQRAIAEAAAAAQRQKIPKGTTLQLSIYDAADFTFWKAEEYHQHYLQKEGEQCQAAASVFEMEAAAPRSSPACKACDARQRHG
mmetsp:Transcript_16211/g.56630  ORF Transcript_16211/g.56630 Transcript_16211/m.56630 type:complete len:167 (-) Transcript_16211:581-1081(-)